MKILYWTTTLLVALAMLASGFFHLTHAPAIAAAMKALGYPSYVSLILGTAKVLGAISLVVPTSRILKEWTYAGFVFLLLGAAASHLFTGVPTFIAPLVILALLLTSYGTWHRLEKSKVQTSL
jgi:uncharacterized membrane protein